MTQMPFPCLHLQSGDPDALHQLDELLALLEAWRRSGVAQHVDERQAAQFEALHTEIRALYSHAGEAEDAGACACVLGKHAW